MALVCLSVGWVILYARMWIEILRFCAAAVFASVILYARMWIEIKENMGNPNRLLGHPLCEDVD